MTNPSLCRLIASLSVWLACTGGARAAPAAPPRDSRYVQFVQLTNENGLSQNTVRCLLQDRQGFLWLGTDDGLNRYDGYGFQIFHSQPDIPAGLPNNRIAALCEDRLGRLWVGTQGGLYRVDLPTGRLVREELPVDGLDGAALMIQSLLESSRESEILWIGTTVGLLRYEVRRRRVIRIPLDPAGGKVLPGEPVTALAESPDGRLWVGRSGGGLSWLDVSTNRFVRSPLGPDPDRTDGDEMVHALFLDRSGVLWVGTRAGLDRLDPRTGICRHLHAAEVKGFTGVNALCQDEGGRIWVGTQQHGLDLYDPSRCWFVDYDSVAEQRSRTARSVILSVCLDRAGNLWLGTSDSGVRKLNRHARQFLLYPSDPDNPRSLPFTNVQSILEDSSGGLWVGGCYGLARSPYRSGEGRSFQRVSLPGAAFARECIHAIQEDPRHPGRVFWLGTEGEGLLRLDIAGGQAQQFVLRDGPDPAAVARSVSTLAWDPGQALWVGTEEGLFVRLADTHPFVPVQGETPEGPVPIGMAVSDLLVDDQGRIWVGTETEGLLVLERNGGRCRLRDRYQQSLNDLQSLSDNRTTCLFQDRSGAIWVGTDGGGLNRFNPSDRTFTRYTTHDGLLSNTIDGILQDETGNLWLSTRHGLACFAPGPGPPIFRDYTMSDGLQGNIFSPGACCRGRGNWMYFGGFAGITAFQGEAIQESRTPPPVVVTALRGEDGRVNPFPPFREGIPVELDYGQAHFTFEFTALDFTVPQRNRFAYRLEGLHDRWVFTDAGHRSATYHKPEPGEFLFRVKAANSDGVWNETGWSIPVIIRPPYWRTGWFRLLVLLVVVLAAGGVSLQWNRNYRRKMAGQREMAEALVETSETERHRIGLELHDNLAHELVGIAVQLRLLGRNHPEWEAEMAEAEDKVKAAIQQTRRIARGIFPLALAENGLPAMLDEIGHTVEQDYGIPCQRGLDEDIRIGDLRAAAHLYYIAREAALNAARHAGTPRIFIGLCLEEGEVVLTVRDFGEHPLETLAPTRTSLGLRIMQYRADLIGATFSVHPAPGGGTEMTCRWPLPPSGGSEHPTR